MMALCNGRSESRKGLSGSRRTSCGWPMCVERMRGVGALLGFRVFDLQRGLAGTGTRGAVSSCVSLRGGMPKTRS